jgi:hypothetical protein
MAVKTKHTFPAANGSTNAFSSHGIELNNLDDLDVYVTLSGGTRVLMSRSASDTTSTSSHPQYNDTTGLYFPPVAVGTQLYNYQLSTANDTITFNQNIPNLGVVSVERRTRDGSGEYTTFAGGSTLRHTDLNSANKESNFTAQEARNKAFDLENKIFGGPATSTSFISSDEIVDGTIVNADINASAAIEGSKLQASTGSNAGSMSAADKSKLDAIEANATGDQTNAEIRAAVEAATDSNVFTDADHSKLNAMDAGATDDQTAAEIRVLVESATDSNVFTDADHSKLNAIEANATADQTAAEIRTLVESAGDSNVFTDADHSKLNAIEASATADQTASEIKTLLQSDKLTASEITTGALDGRYYTETEVDANFYKLGSVAEIQSGESWSAADNKIATTAAIDARITDLVDDVGGFVPIANETSFPNANPDVNNGAGTLVSIKALASNLTSNGSGVATIANGTVGNSTVTITGLANSTTYAATFGMIVETTTTLNTYTFHRQVPKATEVTTVAGNVSNVNAVAGNVSNINAVANNSTNINAVAGNASNINAVAGNASNINNVVAATASINTAVSNATNINTVAGSISNVNNVGGSISNVNNVSSNISDVNNFADLYQISTSAPTTDGGGNSLAAGDLWFDSSSNKEMRVHDGTTFKVVTPSQSVLTDISTVSGNITYSEDLGLITGALTTGTGNSLEVCADNIAKIQALGTTAAVADMALLATTDCIADINTLGTADVVADLNTLGTADVVSDMNTLATTSNVNNMNTVAGMTSNVNTVAGVSSNVTTVAGISGNVTSVAGISSEVTAVAGKVAEVGRLGTADAVADLNTLGTTDVVNDMNTLATTSNVNNMNTVAGISSNVSTVAGVSSNVTTVAGVASNVTSVSNIASNVTTVAGIASNVTTVANDAADIGAVAGKATEIGRLGTADAVADMNTLGTTAIVSDMDTLADISGNITTVAGIASNVTSVAGNASNINSAVSNASNINAAASNASNINSAVSNASNINTVATNNANVTAVAGKATEIGRLGTAAAVADLAILGTTDVVSDLNTLATTAIVSDMDTLADISANITTVADISSNVTTVAGNNANVTTVAGNNANITAVAGNNSNITAVAGNATNINAVVSNATNINAVAADATDIGAVAAKATEIGRLGTAAAVADLAILGTADVVADLNTLGTAAIVEDLNILGTADAVADMNTLATSSNVTNMNTVAGNITNVNNVGGSIANVNTVAGSIADVNRYANEYKIATSPPSSPSEGDLWYDDTNNLLKYYNGSAWESISSGGITSVSADTSPVLGGHLNANSKNITGGGTFTATTFSGDLNGTINTATTATTQAASNNSTKVATTAYVDTAVSNVVDSAPSALNTLNELAAALGDDANYAATTATTIGTKLPKAGGEMTGNITFSGSQTVDGRDLSVDGSKLDGIASSANNYTHPNHSGEVTSSSDGATTITDNVVDEANLKISNTGSNGQYLQKQSGNTGGLTWASVTTYSVGDGGLTQNNFTNTLKSKLDAIEASATADQTDAEIRAAVEAATDSNVFTDADHSKLNGVAASANNYSLPTASSSTLGGIKVGTNLSISNGVLSSTDTNTTYSVGDGGLSQNNFTNTLKSKLDGIEASATGDQTAAEIRSLVNSASDSNVFTDTLLSKLNAIEASATADQTASEIIALIAGQTIAPNVITTTNLTLDFGTI